MSSTNAKPSFGTLLKMSDASGSNHATVAEVGDINFDFTAQVEDVTSHSTSVPWRTKITTLLQAGPITFPINFVPGSSTHGGTTGLFYVYKNRQERNWMLYDPDVGELFRIDGFVSDIKITASVAGVKKGSVTIQGSGQPTWTGV